MDATSRPTPTPPSVTTDVGRPTKRSPLVERRRTSPALAAYVAATIVAGVAALAWATLTLPLAPGIATDGLTHIAADDRVSGLLFWIAFGLLGSVRTKGYGGRAVLTFHLPFIVAAMVLGGPVAGGWVAAIATIELRELREVPWFGTLSNHAIVTIAAVIGGLVVAELRGTLGAVLDPSLAMLAAAACGALVLCAIDVGLSATTIALREGLGRDELASVYNSSFRQTLGAEVILGWLLAVVYVAIAWWAPIACFLIVLIVWRANDEHELTTHDSMTGLLNRRGFDERYAATVRRVRHGQTLAAVLMIDLDKFKAVNDTLGPRCRRRGPQAGRPAAPRRGPLHRCRGSPRRRRVRRPACARRRSGCRGAGRAADPRAVMRALGDRWSRGRDRGIAWVDPARSG